MLVSRLADLYFCPTVNNRDNLRKEGIREDLFITGNTVIDALKTTVRPDYHFSTEELNRLPYGEKKVCLVTCHRRENYGEPMKNIMLALRQIAEENSDVELVYPVHLSPVVREAVDQYLRGAPRVHLIDPLPADEMHNLMFHYLKTGLAGLSPAECDRLENYALTWEIHGSLWLREADWAANPGGYGAPWTDAQKAELQELNDLRRRVREPLKLLSDGMKAAETAIEQVNALYRFMEVLDLQSSLEGQMKALGEQGELQTAEETSQLWGILCGVLDQFVEILGDEAMSPELGEMEYGEDEKLHFGAAYYPERSGCATEYHLISARQRSAELERPVKKGVAEARLAAERIWQLLDEKYPITGEDGTLRPCRPEDIVILMRSPGSRAAVFAAALAERGVPCSFQEQGDYFSSMEVSTLLSLLHGGGINPHEPDF